MNSLWFLSGLPDASGKSLLRRLGFGYMLSPMVAYTSHIIMQAIPARVIATGIRELRDLYNSIPLAKGTLMRPFPTLAHICPLRYLPFPFC